MLAHHHVTWEAERAFVRAKRKRRSVLRRRSESTRLDVQDQRALLRRAPSRGEVREIPLDAIVGTFDAGRAEEFDREFRPAERTRRRWLSIWVAEAAGAPLPPISVMRVSGGFAVLDGHHRVSVAAARGATTIPAVVV